MISGTSTYGNLLACAKFTASSVVVSFLTLIGNNGNFESRLERHGVYIRIVVVAGMKTLMAELIEEVDTDALHHLDAIFIESINDMPNK